MVLYSIVVPLIAWFAVAAGEDHSPRGPCSTTTIAASTLILGDGRKGDADCLETCRTKRNTAEYEMAGVATEKDASELVSFVKELREQVLDWSDTKWYAFEVV